MGPAKCNVCGHVGPFLVHPNYRDNLRETLDCSRCSSNSRDRFLTYVLSNALEKPEVLADWPETRDVRILEPSGYRGRAEILATKVDYRPIHFPRENLERLRDLDESIDHVITADVFEHVRLDETAYREILRVLKPRGFFFLQVPYRPDIETRIRVAPRGDEDDFLEPPEYHAGNTLVYREYGKDLPGRLESLGFAVAFLRGELREGGSPCST